ncbi:oxysterol-binding protein-related protein 9-like isoform X2 [Watersipora subatra]|uniref:oxysterol-binding protein-related protein 9-like isoform X2 n=1 Tax=Watersipora subatra TaxID=2589382 RepID=UPI00355BFA9D
MEGPLSKWTNVMQGWQYRWFVLNENVSLLSYYTSKDKMKRGSRRGCVRLKGAILGIDDDDESTFTITTHDQKTFHFQARDREEREKWMERLEESINRASKPRGSSPKEVPSSAELDRKLAETDAYLQLLIQQVKPREEAEEENGFGEELFDAAEGASQRSSRSNSLSTTTPPLCQSASHLAAGDHRVSDSPLLKEAIKQDSDGHFSSSDEEEFFDTTDHSESSHTVAAKKVEGVVPKVTGNELDKYDGLYDEGDEEGLGSLKEHGSIITHLLSQVRIGMDLTKIVLPTFILERRSLLEMFADFFSHPDLFVRIGDYSTPEERITEVVRWYMSAFHAGRNASVARKPYNPILGETFQCVFEIPGEENSKESLAEDGPVKWATKSDLCYIAEQVSHHPPISAFYAECQKKRISLDGYIWMKSKFLGLSIGVDLVGEAVISLLDHDEEYKISFPSGYGRSILTVPWIELGGKCNISCEKTGCSAVVEFLTKPFYSNKKHAVKGVVSVPGYSKPFCVINGEWNGLMFAEYASGRNEAFCDTLKMPIVKKRVQPISEQDPFESRRLWKDVTYHLKHKDVNGATTFKHELEQAQREAAQQRKETGAKIEHKHFQEVGENWVYMEPLVQRISSLPDAVNSGES